MKKYMFIAPIDDLRPIFSPNDDICPYYLIDRSARIFSEYSGLELKQITTSSGYKVVSLNTISGKRIQRRPHRLAMFTFNYQPGCENMQVDHLNGDKENNNINENCEWVTGSENVRRAINNGLRKGWNLDNNPKAKITSEQALIIFNMVIQGYSNEDILDIIPEANNSIITEIILGKTWKSLFTEEQFLLMRNIRYPIILSVEQKHMICKYFQDFPKDKNHYYGAVKEYITKVLYNLNIPINDSTFRMAKRLYYRYQDTEITSLYKY